MAACDHTRPGQCSQWFEDKEDADNCGGGGGDDDSNGNGDDDEDEDDEDDGGVDVTCCCCFWFLFVAARASVQWCTVHDIEKDGYAIEIMHDHVPSYITRSLQATRSCQVLAVRHLDLPDILVQTSKKEHDTNQVTH